MTAVSRRLLLTTAIAPLAAPALRAQPAFPAGPITLVVPFSKDGPAHTVARLLAEPLSTALGEPVGIEIVEGAGGTIGAMKVAQARPDGQTLLLHHVGMATVPTLFRRLDYHPIESFEPLGRVLDIPLALIARGGFPAATLPEISTVIRERGMRISAANAGLGSASHLAGLLLQSSLDTPVTVIAYRGTSPAMQNMIGGRIDLMCDQTPNLLRPLRDRKIQAFATATASRLPLLGDLPTAAEGGLSSLDLTAWYGLYAPKGIPDGTIGTLHRALHAALDSATLQRRASAIGGTLPDPARNTLDGHRLHWQTEIARWRPFLRVAERKFD